MPSSDLTHWSLERIEECARTWQTRLGLTHWRVVVKRGGEIEGSILEVHRHENAYRAIIYARDWLLDEEWDKSDSLEDLTDQYIESAVVHELFHLCFHRLGSAFKKAMEDHVSSALWGTLAPMYSDIEEYEVDQVARHLVDAWPTEEAFSYKRDHQILGKVDRPVEQEWMMQEMDDSVQIVPLHEGGHILGKGEGVLEDDPWCWCEPKVETQSESGEIYAVPQVVHRDLGERMGLGHT